MKTWVFCPHCEDILADGEVPDVLVCPQCGCRFTVSSRDEPIFGHIHLTMINQHCRLYEQSVDGPPQEYPHKRVLIIHDMKTAEDIVSLLTKGEADFIIMVIEKSGQPYCVVVMLPIAAEILRKQPTSFQETEGGPVIWFHHAILKEDEIAPTFSQLLTVFSPYGDVGFDEDIEMLAKILSS